MLLVSIYPIIEDSFISCHLLAFDQKPKDAKMSHGFVSLSLCTLYLYGCE